MIGAIDRPRQHLVIRYLGVTFMYAAATLAISAPAVVHIGTRLLGAGNDPLQTVWNISWIEGWLHGQHGLFFTHQLLYPQGANLGWMTLSLPTATVGALLAPVLGLVGAYNVAILAALAANGTAMYALARRLGLRGYAPLLAGLAFLASPYFVGQLVGHLDLVGAFGTPLFIASLWGILDREKSSVWQFVALGAVLALVAYGAEEYALLTLMAAATIVVAHPRVRQVGPMLVIRLWRGWMVAFATFSVLVTPLFKALEFGPLAAGSGPRIRSARFVTDLLGYFVPAPWGPFASLRPSWNLAANIADGSWFPGFLVWAAVVVLLAWREGLQPAERRLILMAGVGAGAFAVLSLGPNLHVDRYSLAIPLPDRFLRSLPIWNQTLPERFSMLTVLFGAVLVAVAAAVISRRLSTPSAGPGTGRRSFAGPVLVLGACGLTALGAVAAPFPSILPRPTPFASDVRAAGGSVLFVPSVVEWTNDSAGSDDYMYVDAVLDMPTPEGYLTRLPRSTIDRINALPVLTYLAVASVTSGSQSGPEHRAAQALPSYLRAEDIRSVVFFADELRNPEMTVGWVRANAGGRSHLRRYKGHTWILFLKPSQKGEGS